MTRFQKKLCLGLMAMVLLSPLGLVLPARFGAGDAWGEWSTGTLAQLLGYVPAGLRRYADLWPAPIPDYNLGGEGASTGLLLASYIASGLVGIAAAGLAVYGLSRLLVRHER
ncbi:MAG: cobalamin biosynthesis protein [Candidatus Latescibacteria bacterium]|nr:cobalamin biosynthesis protein [Candidatus Latescibacterota bacterium]